jgi:shikimate dehydrogenase
MTKRFAVAGSPIAHSRSPVMHEAAYRALGIDATYGLRVAEIADVPALVDELQRGVWDGCNITTPLKTEVARHCSCDAVSAKAGAVNTVWLDKGTLKGALTDVDGIREPLSTRGVRFTGKGHEAVILGAGGAARAAALALASMGARVSVAARNAGKAEEVLTLLDPGTRGDAMQLAKLAAPQALTEVRVLVQATSLGREGESLALGWEGASLTAFEMLYTPRETPFLKAAKAAGCATIEGWEMLLAQGARSFELWLSRQAPRAVMRDALLASL